MRISAKAEYACIAMFELALTHADAAPARVKTIAERHRISPQFLVQILLQLKNAGLVLSSRGAGGGYHLAESPDQISLADIVHAVEPPSGRSRTGSLSPIMNALRDVWDSIEPQEERCLRDVTLADLV